MTAADPALPQARIDPHIRRPDAMSSAVCALDLPFSRWMAGLGRKLGAMGYGARSGARNGSAAASGVLGGFRLGQGARSRCMRLDGLGGRPVRRLWGNGLSGTESSQLEPSLR